MEWFCSKFNFTGCVLSYRREYKKAVYVNGRSKKYVLLHEIIKEIYLDGHNDQHK